MSYGGQCEVCKETVRTSEAAYPVTGWEVVRDGGGANRILGRERVPGRIAHWWCAEEKVRRDRFGLEGQVSLGGV